MKIKQLYLWLLILVFTLFANISKAQNAGFAGKYCILKYNAIVNYYKPIFSDLKAENPVPIRNYIGSEFIISDNKTVGFYYKNANTNFTVENSIGDVNSWGIGLSYSFYDNNSAPLGFFYSIMLDYNFYDYEIRYNDWLGFSYLYIDDFQAVSFGLQAGLSGVVFNNFVYSFGVQYGFQLPYPIFGGEDFIKDNALKRTAFNNAWGVHLGIGLLLF